MLAWQARRHFQRRHSSGCSSAVGRHWDQHESGGASPHLRLGWRFLEPDRSRPCRRRPRRQRRPYLVDRRVNLFFRPVLSAEPRQGVWTSGRPHFANYFLNRGWERFCFGHLERTRRQRRLSNHELPSNRHARKPNMHHRHRNFLCRYRPHK